MHTVHKCCVSAGKKEKDGCPCKKWTRACAACIILSVQAINTVLCNHKKKKERKKEEGVSTSFFVQICIDHCKMETAFMPPRCSQTVSTWGLNCFRRDHYPLVLTTLVPRTILLSSDRRHGPLSLLPFSSDRPIN